METQLRLCVTVFLAATRLHATAASTPIPGPGASASRKAIPWNQVGAAAGAQHSGEGLRITASEHGARVHCAFQRLDGEATRDGLWLTSTVPSQPHDSFRVKAVAVTRNASAARPRPAQGSGAASCLTGEARLSTFSATGDVSVEGQTVWFTRPGLVEEYTVSMDGVQQDFLILEKPGGASVAAWPLASRLAGLADAEIGRAHV